MNIFVYGTLKPGESNYYLCKNYVIAAKPAIAHGKLFHLPIGYPAMTLGQDQVHGYLLSFANSQLLPTLDELEDYDPKQPKSENIYNRQYIEVFQPKEASLGQAWAYLMTPEKVSQFAGIPVLDGCWNG